MCGLVTSILDGYNVCIMAYGQTGSGKTYTIEGPAEDPGVNSRALAELFRVAADRSSDIQYAFSASVLEIYNEQIFDLLAGSRDTGEGAVSVLQMRAAAGCALREGECLAEGVYKFVNELVGAAVCTENLGRCQPS